MGRSSILFIVLFILAGFEAFSQYHITYEVKYYDEQGNELRPTHGYDNVYHEYYITDGYYKSILDGGNVWIQCYDGKKNTYYAIDTDKNVQKSDASVRHDGPKLLSIVKTDSTTEVLNYNCNSLKLTYEDNQVTYFYSPEIKVDPKSFELQKFGDWGQIIQASEGAVPLIFITEKENVTEIGRAINIEKVYLDASDFKVHNVMKEVSKSNQDKLNQFREKFVDNYGTSEIEIEDIETFTMYTKYRMGKAVFPVKYIVKKPHFQFTESFFGSYSYIESIYDSTTWSYDPVENVVNKYYEQKPKDQFNLFAEYQLIKDFDKEYYNILDIRPVMDSLETRVVLAHQEDRIIFHFDNQTFFLSEIERDYANQRLFNYKRFQGIPMPTKIIERSGKQDITLLQDSIFFNLPYKDSFFFVPDSLQDLVNEIKETKTAEEYYEIAESHKSEGELQLAVENYNKAIELDNSNFLYYNQLGLVKLNLNDLYGAITAFSKATELNPRAANPVYNLGYAKMTLGDVKASIKDYNRAIELNPNNPLYYNYRGLSYYKLQNYDTAYNDFNMTTELDSTYFIAYWNQGMSAFRIDKYDTAIQAFNFAEKYGRETAELYNYRGICYFRKGQYNSAYEDFKKATSFDNPLANYYSNLADACVNLNMNDEAIKYYEKELEIDSTCVDCYNSIGLIYFKEESFNAAKNYFSKALEMNPNEAQYYDNRANTKMRLMDFLGAIDDYSSSLSLYPDDSNIYFLRGQAKLNVNNRFDACVDFKKAAELGLEKAEEALENNCSN